MTNPIDAVEQALTNFKDEPGVLERLAFASTHSHGERALTDELAYQLRRAGHRVGRECKAGGITRVDLVVNGEPFEVKSTFSKFGVVNTEAATTSWLAADAHKLAPSTVPAHQIIAISTLIDGATHARFRVAEGSVPNMNQMQVREAAIARYRHLLGSNALGGATQARLIHLGRGHLHDVGAVLTDVLLFTVDRRAPSST